MRQLTPLDFFLLLPEILTAGVSPDGNGFFVKQLGNIGFGLFDNFWIIALYIVFFDQGHSVLLFLRTESLASGHQFIRVKFAGLRFEPKKTGQRLQNSVFDIGGGRPKIYFVPLDRRLLGVFYYEGKEYDFNFSKLHLMVKTEFTFEEQDDKVIWHVRQENIHAAMETEVHCLKKNMLLINYEAPDGSRHHNRLWNGGNGWGIVKLYDRQNGQLILTDEIEATHIGCEYGEYDHEEPYSGDTGKETANQEGKANTRLYSQDRIERVKKYEKLFDEAVTSHDPEKLRILEAYYTSGEWMEDYEADELGELPPDLKRGVLSQDALYELLEEAKL